MEAVRRWVRDEARRHPELVRLGCFGSYARGDQGPGSDLDLVAVVREAEEPFERRGLSWRTEDLPVPADLLVYTEAEWRRVTGRGDRFERTMAEEVVWLWQSAEDSGANPPSRR